MLCSKCKVISIHLPNYDSYICENGHILCRSCNDRIRQKCSICGGRIVRQTEFRLEGVPTAFFKNSANEPVIYSDVDSECERTYRSDSISAGGLGNGWAYHYSRDYDSECGSADKVSCCEDLNWNLNNGNVPIGDYYYMSLCNNGENIARLPNNVGEVNWRQQQQQQQQSQEGRRENTSTNFKENKSQVNLKQSKSICKFKTPPLDETYIVNMPKSPQYDPKKLYHKTINGEVDFDPKLDYYQKSAQVNEIQEFFKRPNLELARKSSSRMEFKERSIQSDSVTLLEHLNEFRNATNYIPPPEIEVYSINENPIRSEPTIITKSKNNVNKESFTDYNVREKIDECKISEKASEQKDKVDVGTMIDLCIDPCLNLVNFHSLGSCAGDYGSCNQMINQMSQSIGAHTNNNNNSNKEFEQVKENAVNMESMEPTSVIDEKDLIAPNTQMSLRNLLREKLRSEVYSQFEKSPVQQRNNFITKTRYKPNPVVALHVDTFKDMNRTNITEIINQEIEKALNKLSAPEDVMTPIQKREEIIRQSKNQVRERLLQQIYSNFNDKMDSVRSTFSKSDCSLGQLSSREILSEKQIEVKDYAEPINDDNNSHLCTCHNQAKELRNVALSTESYPKLNPQLAVLTVPRARTQVSATNSDIKITHDSKCSCNAQTSMPIIHLQDDAEKDVICEIQKQFEDQQRQITLQQLESLRSMSKVKSQSLTSTPVVIDADAENRNAEVVQSNSCVENLPSKEKKLDRGNGHDSKYKIFEESQISKLSEGPFIQSCVKAPFESSAESPYPNPLGNQFFDLATAVTVATIYQTENLMQCISYPEKSVSDEKMIHILKDDDPMKVVARTLADDFREEPARKSENDLDIPDFVKFLKEKFPNISLKEIKDVVVNLPYDNMDHNAELCTELSFDETFGSKHNLIISSDTSTEKHLETTENFSNFSSVTVNAWRAFYSPPSTEVEASSEPTPQFRVISRLDLEGSLLENSLKEIRIAADLNIPRSPVICPITTCNKLIFVSEFSKHIKVDHVKIPVESISPGKCKNLFLDPKVDHHGVNKCHILYLVTDKIRDLGSREYKDFLPVLVMSTKVSLLELVCSEFRTRNREVARNRQNFLMIWLTGLSPTDLPIYFSLTAWSRCGPIPKCHIVHSGKLYSIRNGQDARSLFRNGQVLLLSNEQCCMLTNDGRNMIELQVVVH